MGPDAGGAEPSGPPVAIGQLVHFLPANADDGCKNELGDTNSRLDNKRFGTRVVQRTQNFAPISAIDNDDAVGKGDAVFAGQATPGVQDDDAINRVYNDGNTPWDEVT